MPEHRVVLLDLDGVVFWRVPAQKAGLPVLGDPKVREKFYKPVSIKPARKYPIDYRFKPKSIYDGVRHSLAPAFPDVVRLIKQAENATFYGGTGRHNTEAMTLATTFSLTWAGVERRFDDIYFRPEGYTTAETKVSALADIRRQWDDDQIEVADDNPADLLPMSRTFPNLRFHLIRDLTTDRLLRGIDLAQDFPNVDINRTLRQALTP